MKDYAVFMQDIKDEEDNTVFEKDKRYRILGEDDTSLYIQLKPHTNQVSQFPLESEGKVFKCVVE